MVNFDTQFKPEQLEALRRALSPGQFVKAVRSSISKTTSHVASEVRKYVRTASTMDVKHARRAITSSVTDDTGHIKIAKQSVPLAAFDYKAGKRQLGVSVQISTDKPALQLLHSFEARMPSGHLGIFSRASTADLSQDVADLSKRVAEFDQNWERTTALQKRAGYVEKNPAKLLMAKHRLEEELRKQTGGKEFVGRLPLKELRGESVYNLLTQQGEAGLKKISDEAGKYLRKTALGQLNRFVFKGNVPTGLDMSGEE